MPVQTEITQAGTYDLAFANVDGRLTLWVNGRLPFGKARDVRDRPTNHRHRPPPISSRRGSPRIGASIEVDRLVLKRDVYYTLEPAESDYSNLDGSARIDHRPCSTSFPTRPFPQAVVAIRHVTIRSGREHYLMLGDNSPGAATGGPGEAPTRSTQTFPARAGIARAVSPGRSRSTLDRQGILRLLAASQAGLAPAPS